MKIISFRGDYISGRFLRIVPERGRRTNPDPGDLDHPLGDVWFDKSHVAPAVAAAKKAFPGWRDLGPIRRGRYLTAFHRAVSRRRKELAHLITRQMGKPFWEAEQEVARFLDRIDRKSTRLNSSH